MQGTGRIASLGDWHGNTKYALEAIEYTHHYGAEVLIHTGDFAFHFEKKFISPIHETLEKNNQTLMFIDGNHECLSEDTRALTRHGFRTYSELQVGDEVLSCDDDGNESWQKVQKVTVAPYQGLMTSIQSRALDMLVTPNHRIVYKSAHKKYKSGFDESYAEDLVPKNQVIYKSVINRNSDYNISDDMIRLYAWCTTDANQIATYKYWRISQKESGVDRILDILDRLGIRYTTNTRTRAITEICGKTLKNPPEREVTVRIAAENGRQLPWSREELWDKVWMFSRRQFDIFLEDLVYCDGSWGSNATTQRNKSAGVLYCPKQTWWREGIQRLLVLNGYRTSITRAREGDVRLNFCSRATVSLNKQGTTITKVPYTGTVWCVTVPNGRFFVERNGKVYLTGNSYDYLAELPSTNTGLGAVTSRIFHIPRGFRWSYQVDGKPITFMGVGGAISIDRRWRKTHHAVNGGRPLYWEEEAITDEDVERAIAPGAVDVLITHDAPMGSPAVASKIPLEPMIQADCDDSRRKVRKIVNATKPLVNIHGHYHYFYESHLLLEGGHMTKVIGLDCDGSELFKNVELIDLKSLSHHLRE